MNWIYKNGKWVGLIVILVMMLILIPRLASLSVEDIINFSPASLPLAALAFVLFYMVKPITLFFPIALLYVSAGHVFPTHWAFAVTYSGLAVMISIGYFFGKKLGANKVEALFKRTEKSSNFLFGKTANISSLCFVSRVLPLPINACNMFLGAIKMPYAKYIFISLVGMSPTMIPTVIAGTHITNPLSAEFIVPFVISIFIAFTSFIIFERMNKVEGESQL